MSEPEPRPSWMPSDEEIARAFYAALQARLHWKPTDHLHRLIERTALKAQIEVADEIAGFRVARFTGYELADRLAEKLRARLSELEGSHE